MALLAFVVLVTGITAASRLVLKPGYFDLRKLKIRVEGTFTV
jgi:hypothetical protein